jgi:hypothetical protein
VAIQGTGLKDVKMRCPACNAENAQDARKCASCGGKLRRRSRRAEAAEGLTQESELGGRLAMAAYRCAVFGMIPLAGLLLGPLAVILGLVAYRRIKATPEKSTGPVLAVVTLGLAVLVTNWVGVTLMVLGWLGG